jgi:hypothetical protein
MKVYANSAPGGRGVNQEKLECGAAAARPRSARSGGQRFDHFVQAALMACCLVLVHDTLVDHAVDDWHGGFVGRCRAFLIAFFDRSQNTFDVGPQF